MNGSEKEKTQALKNIYSQSGGALIFLKNTHMVTFDRRTYDLFKLFALHHAYTSRKQLRTKVTLDLHLNI